MKWHDKNHKKVIQINDVSLSNLKKIDMQCWWKRRKPHYMLTSMVRWLWAGWYTFRMEPNFMVLSILRLSGYWSRQTKMQKTLWFHWIWISITIEMTRNWATMYFQEYIIDNYDYTESKWKCIILSNYKKISNNGNTKD